MQEEIYAYEYEVVIAVESNKEYNQEYALALESIAQKQKGIIHEPIFGMSTWSYTITGLVHNIGVGVAMPEAAKEVVEEKWEKLLIACPELYTTRISFHVRTKRAYYLLTDNAQILLFDPRV